MILGLATKFLLSYFLNFSISEEEFNLLETILKEVIDIDGSLFDPPPGTVIGNIVNVDDVNDVAVGYFSVASVSFVRNFINSNELDFFVRPKCAGFFLHPTFWLYELLGSKWEY